MLRPARFQFRNTNVFGAGRYLDFGGPFHRTHERVRVVHRRKVIDAAGVWEELRPRAVLAHLLVHPVNVADHGLGLGDPLAVHRHQDAQNAMRGRVLGPQVEHKGLRRSLARWAGRNGFFAHDHGW